MTEAPPQQRAAFVERRRATVSPIPNPGRRASDRVEYLAELARRDQAGALASTPRWLRRYAATLVVADLLSAAVAGLVAAGVRFDANPSSRYLLLTALFPIGWVIAAAANRAYEPRFLGAGADEYRRLFDAAVRFGAVIAVTAYAVHSDLARGYLFLAMPLATLFSLLSRRVARRMLAMRREQGRCSHKVIVVGTERAAAELIRQVRRQVGAGFEVAGACVTRSTSRRIEGVPVVGTSAEVVDALRATGADTVAIAAWSDLSSPQLRRLSWQLEDSGVTMVVAPSLTDIAGPRIHIRPVAGLPLLHVEQPQLRGLRRAVKEAVDRILALVALLMLSPLMLGIAMAVRTTSRGPALFRQTRVGLRGRPFTIYKFRTMRVDAEALLPQLQALNEASDGLLFKVREDPRITRVGRVLRRLSLDELPQLFNVLLGTMSLVGPRPPLPAEVDRYGGDVGRRLLVKPGVTGLWQVSGRSDLPWPETVRLDLHYVENWSLALDIAIMWKTLRTVLKGSGAY